MIRQTRSRGQGVVEYILITALISLAAVAIFKSFRDDIAEAYRRAGTTLLASFDDGGAPPAP